MLRVGDTIEAVGMGKIFVSTVVGSSGMGEVLHVGGVETSDFPEKERYEELFPEQTKNGIFYRDSGTGQALWLSPDDYKIISGGDTVEE